MTDFTQIKLDIADGIYEPSVVAHVPGVANVTADALSRLHEKGSTHAFPTTLLHSTKVKPPNRTHSWWRSLATPATP